MKVTIFTHNTSPQYFKALYYLAHKGKIEAKLLDNIHILTKPYEFFKIDVLIPFYGPFYPQIIVAQIAKKKGIRNIFMNSWEKWQEGEYVKYYCPKRLWYKYLKDVECVSISKRAAEDIKLFVAKSYYIPHSVDAELFKPINVERTSGNLNVLFVGYLERYKGVDKVLSAAKQLKDERILFHFAGTDSYEDAIKKEKNCIYHGFIKNQKEIVKLYNQCDILVQPSEFEKFGIAMIESLSCEIPVITTPTTGAMGIFDDKRGGITIGFDNTVMELTKAIKYLAENKSLRRKMGEEGREKVLERYNVKVNADKWAKVLGV